MDWVQSQVLRIYNCSSLTLDLKTGTNTISQLLSGKLLIVEDVAQLTLTGFTVGIPYNVDKTVSKLDRSGNNMFFSRLKRSSFKIYSKKLNSAFQTC